MPSKVQEEVNSYTSAASAYSNTALATGPLHRVGQKLCGAENRQELGSVLTYTAAGSLTAMIWQQPPTVSDICESVSWGIPEQ